jgi:hypothetical protein
LSKRSFASFSDSCRVESVWRVSASRSSSATIDSQLLATAATRLIWAALRPSSVARYWASAASLRLAMRPKKSISQALSARPALNELARWPLLFGAREAFSCAPTVGNSSARRIWYRARACSIASTATRRSRLPCSASAISSRSRGSGKKACHSVSAAAGVPSVVASCGQVAATGAAGRSYFGAMDVQAASMALAASATSRGWKDNVIPGLLPSRRAAARVRARGCTSCAGARCP